MSLPATGYVQQVEVVVGGTLPRAGFVQPVEIVGGGGGSVSGSGSPGQIAYWDGASSITGDNGLMFSDTDLTVTVTGNGGNPQLVLAWDGTFYTEFQTDSAGYLFIRPSAGLVSIVSASASSTSLGISNTSTGFASIAMEAQAGGGDAYGIYYINGGSAWAAGVDNSDSDAWVISATAVLGASNRMRIATGGEMTVFGNLITSSDNSFDIGAAAATRFRTIYAATSLVAGTAGWTMSATAATGLTAQANARFAHGTSALATNATEGFFHLQSCAGTPTGVPASIPTGQIPMVWDSTNNLLYAYDAGWVVAGGSITGSGASARVALWSGASTLTSLAGITYAAPDVATRQLFLGVTGAQTGYIILATAVGGGARVGTIWCDDTNGGIHMNTTGNSYPIELNGNEVRLWPGATSGWTVNSSRHLMASVDNSYDIGAAAATRPRTVYAATSFVAGSAGWTMSATAATGLTAQGNARFAHGTSALATNATEGFFHLQSCAGTPTGVPASIPTGQIPLVWDSTNNLLYAYDAGWVNVSAGGGVTGSGSNTQVVYWTGASTVSGDAGMTYDAANDRLVVAGRIGIASGVPDVPLHIGTGGSIQGQIRMESAGGTNRQVSLYVPAAGGLQVDTNSNSYAIEFNGSEIRLWPGATNGWTVNGSRHIVPTVDNSYDVGVLAGNRPRSVIVATDVSVGTNPGTTGPVRIPYNAALTARNSGNSDDIPLIRALTINSVANYIKVGDPAKDAGVILTMGSSVGGAPTTSDLADGEWCVWDESGGGDVRVFARVGGTIYSTPVFT